MTTKTLAYSALLAALSVVLARLFGLMPDTSSRYSIEAVPIFLAGILLGPLPGAMVGFTADFVGCLFSPYGYNPIFCIPPILYGLCGGLFRKFLQENVSLWRLLVAFVVPAVFGSVLYQSCTLSYMYYEGSFLKGLVFYLSTRSIQFAIVTVIDVLLVWLLFRTNIFTRMGLCPAKKQKKEENENDC
jgi:ECF transporter S component (folate family)